MWQRATDTELVRWRGESVDVLAGVVENAPGTPVPAYPPWTVCDLAVHVIRIFGNAALSLRSGSLDRPQPSLVVTPRSEPADLAAALRDALVGAERELVECAHAQVWAPVGPRPPEFWSRRMLREAVLHRLDAEEGRGHAPLPGDDVALELVDEFVDSEVVRIAASGATGPTGLLEFRTPLHAWRVGFGDSARAHLDGDAPIVSSVTATPVGLWLWLMRRDPPEGEVTIDDADGSVARFAALIDAINRPGGEA